MGGKKVNDQEKTSKWEGKGYLYQSKYPGKRRKEAIRE